MTRAFIGVSLIAVLSGVIGTFMMLKGLAFIGDAIAHASFGGLVVALLLGFSLHLGALFIAVFTAVSVTALGRKTTLRPDTSLVIIFTGAFSLGILGLSLRPSFAGDLSTLLLGSVLAIQPLDLYWIAAAVGLVGLVCITCYHHLVFIVFDPAGAEACGLPVTGLQLLLLILVALSVVVSLQAVGVILVVALLITPAATASLLTRKIKKLMQVAVLIGLIATWTGLYVSYYFAFPTGATIVVIVTFLFTIALIINKATPLLTKKKPTKKNTAQHNSVN